MFTTLTRTREEQLTIDHDDVEVLDIDVQISNCDV
jgi:hypothetical protein